MAGTVKTVRYENLRGVDFSRHPSKVDRSRSPYCLNMMPDSSLCPVKRPGWQVQYSVARQVHNIWFCTLGGTKHMICHCNDRFYLMGKELPVKEYKGLSSGKGCGFYALKGGNEYFWMLTTGEYCFFDGSNFKRVKDEAYVPVIKIAKKPDGTGETYEDINCLTPKRKEYFTGTETDLVYQLGADNIDSVDKVEIRNANGDLTLLINGEDYTCDLTLGRITFVTPHKTEVVGEDNVLVEYSKTIDGYSDRIERCTVCAQFGLGGENRVFLSGNPDYKAMDFWSDIYNPSYFPDLNYAIIGSGQTAIMGYLKLGDQLGIVKQGNGQDTALYLRSAQQYDDRALFTVQAGINNIGAVSKHCFATLNDQPMFLSHQGVFAVVNNALTSEKMVQNRSYQVDARLTAEKGLQNAVACVWRDFYILSVNGNCYLLDGRQIISAQNGERNSRYEAYYWNNVEAVSFAVDDDGVLWFGTEKGRICCFKDESTGKSCYSDNGQPIHAIWTTPAEDEGCVERFKNLRYRGNVVTLKPYSASGCKVYYNIDDMGKQFVREERMDIFSFFTDVNFTRLCFISGDSPREIYFNRHKRRYKRLQLIFENDAVDEGFGIYGIVKTFETGGYSKNRRY